MNDPVPGVNNLPGVFDLNIGVHLQYSAYGLTDYFNIPFYGSSGFQIIPEFKKISFFGQEKIDLLNSLFYIRKPSPDLIFHTLGLLFFQSVASGTGFL